MLQLSLDFIGRHLGRLQPTPVRQVDPAQPFLWKHDIWVNVVRHPRARRYLLRLQPDGIARLVIPRRGSRAEGLRFLERSEGWLLKQVVRARARTPIDLPWLDGTRFLFRGEETVLDVKEITRGVQLDFGREQFFHATVLADYRGVVQAHLRQIAERELPPRTRELAHLHGIDVKRVTVRAQKTRWGSCSARGTISLNWRVIHAPEFVVDYLIIHELMHRREMNHSTRYWKLVAAACPGYREAERWLKKTRISMT